MVRWAASLGAAAGAALAIAAAPWDALVAGFGGEPHAVEAAAATILRAALATTAGAFLGIVLGRALDRRGGGGPTGALLTLAGAALALAALPRVAGGDPATALVWAPVLGFILPALALLPWALRR
ncbi:MAG: hypothetical protein H6701_03325 [Myxococcales bacterium]|nr:hypothetical protein [Myxococcales bacterium]